MLSVMILTPLALSLAAGAENEAARAPSDELVQEACSHGLLLRAPDGDAAGATALSKDAARDFPGLFGAAGGADAGSKPKTRLLRPRQEDGKCPEDVRSFYARYGRKVDAVPAPNLPADQIESHIDRVFSIISAQTRKKRLSQLTDGNLSQRRATVDRLFDGVSALSETDFTRINANLTRPAQRRIDRLLKDGTGTMPGPDGPAVVAVAYRQGQPSAATLAPANAGPLTATMRQRFSPDRPIAVSTRYTPPPVGTYEPPGEKRPKASSWLNQNIPDYVWRWSGKAADKIWGGGDPKVNVELPPGIGTPPIYRRVRTGFYGTSAMVHGLLDVTSEMAQMNAPTIEIGDISLRNGGSFTGHASHRVGKDVDVYFFTDERGRFDVPWNLLLAAEAVKHMDVSMIFVDQKLIGMMSRYLASATDIPSDTRVYMTQAVRVMQHWPNHQNHFHIRIN